MRFTKPALVVALAACTFPAFAKPAPKAPHKTKTAIKRTVAKKPTAKAVAKQDLICPVTGEKIASVAKAAGSSTYKGKTYYFCCASCKPMFDKNPAKYVKTAKK